MSFDVHMVNAFRKIIDVMEKTIVKMGAMRNTNAGDQDAFFQSTKNNCSVVYKYDKYMKHFADNLMKFYVVIDQFT